MAELDIEVGLKLAGATDKLSNALLNRQRYKSAYHKRGATAGVADATGTLILGLGSPPVGEDWSINVVTVTGADDHTVITGSNVALYIGDPANPGLTDLVIPSNGNTVPNVFTASREVIWVHNTETVYVIISGLTSGQQILATSRFDAWKSDEVELEV